ncbi:MAG: FAD-dependent oxidoreductase [Paucibacter sp.]|nr:FAD-dependent oxidoreductase [Roseateles sp.]
MPRIAIIGAGIAGVSTALELAADGHEVSVFDRRGSVAAEASFANAGTIAPALALPWTQPRFGLGWRGKQWRAARHPAFAERAAATLRLAVYSHQRLQALRKTLQLDYERAEGQLVLLRDKADREAIAPGLERLAALGLVVRELDAAGCRAVEPGLNPEAKLFGGVQLPLAEVGNCRQFAHLLRVEAQKLGARFRFHTTVRSLDASGEVVHEYTPPEELAGAPSSPPDAGDTVPQTQGPRGERFDAIVVCAALDGARLLGRKLPLRTAVSHSITAPLRQLEAHPDLGPRGGLTDHQLGVSLSRIGQRVRATAGDEASAHKSLNDWFPGASLPGQALRWSGEHVELPDGLPLIGGGGRLWINLAHPDAGFTLASGAARVISERLAGRKAEVDVSGLDLDRLG